MNAVRKYRERRILRLERRFGEYHGPARFDADDEETNNGGGNSPGGHGNTRIPYGLCQREGIKIQPNWTPKDAWDALAGKGYSASDVYKELKETGKVPKEKPKEPEKPKMDKKQANKVIREYKAKKKELDDILAERSLYRWQETDAKDEKNRLAKKTTEVMNRIEEMEKQYGSRYDMPEDVKKQYDAEFETLRANNAAWKKADEEEKAVRAKKDELKKRYEEKSEEYKESKKQYHEAIKTKFPTYRDCKNKNDLKERILANEYFQTSTEWKTSFGRLELEDAATLAEDFDAFFEKNPKLIGKLHYFEVRALRGYSGLSWPDEKVQLDAGTFEKREKKKEIQSTGFHPETGDFARQVVFHEYTHQIDDYMSKKLGLKYHGFSSLVYDEVVKRLQASGSELVTGLEERIPDYKKGDKRKETILEGLIMERVKRSVSEYAYKYRSVHKDHCEFLAEAYAGFLDKPNPGEVEKIVGQIVTEYIDKLED